MSHTPVGLLSCNHGQQTCIPILTFEALLNSIGGGTWICLLVLKAIIRVMSPSLCLLTSDEDFQCTRSQKIGHTNKQPRALFPFPTSSTRGRVISMANVPTRTRAQVKSQVELLRLLLCKTDQLPGVARAGLRALWPWRRVSLELDLKCQVSRCCTASQVSMSAADAAFLTLV